MKKEEVHIEIPIEYITTGNQGKIAEILSKAAEELRKKVTQDVFASISDATDSVGNKIPIKGKALTPDDIYNLFEKVQLDFDKNGNIKDSFKLYCHPDNVKDLMRVSQEIESDPILKQRFNEQEVRKKEEWRVRESNRKLVG